jgi:hypothetical protein
MMVAFAWRLYYADGSTFSDADGAPWASPITPRVAAIGQPCAGEQWDTILVNGTWWLWRTDVGYWTNHDTEGDVCQELIEGAPTIGAVRRGIYLPRPAFRALWARAREDQGVR